MIKNIVFDLCGVLIDFNPRYLYRKIFKEEKDVSFFLNNVLTRDTCALFDRGENPKEITECLSKSFPEYKEAIKAYDSRWDEMLGGKINGTYEILDELKGMSYGIYGLSNFPLSKFKNLDTQYMHAIPPEHNMISATEKVCKPNPRIYKIFLNRFDLNARECLFVDNNLVYVEAAIKEGMRGIHFTSPQKLKTDLECMGLI